MARAALVFTCCLLLLSAGLAGCMGDDSGKSQQVAKRGAQRTAASVNLSAIEEQIGERPIVSSDPPTVNDWFVMSASASPDGNLTGFRMPLPLASVIGMRFNFYTGVMLEIAPVVVDGATIQDWCLFVFREEENQATLAGHGGTFSSDARHPERVFGNHCSFAEERVLKDVVDGDNASATIASTSPGYMIIEDPLFLELNNVYFVLAATSDKPTPFGLAFRFLPQYPSGYFPGSTNPNAQPASSLDAFLANRSGTRPKAVHQLGTGTGFFVSYWSANRGLAPAPNSTIGTFESSAGLDPPAPMVEGHPGGAVWNFNLSVPHDTSGGWSFVYGSYTSYCGTGKYQASANLHGRAFVSRSVIAQHAICGALYGSIPGALLFGFSEFMFVGGGSGPSTLSYELLVAGAILEQITLFHITVGTPLDQLIKIPARPATWTNSGVAGNVPP